MLGDGRTLTRGLALGEVEIEGVKRPVLVAIGGDEEAPIIGYTTLENLGFKVNQITRRLERTPAIELLSILCVEEAPPSRGFPHHPTVHTPPT